MGADTAGLYVRNVDYFVSNDKECIYAYPTVEISQARSGSGSIWSRNRAQAPPARGWRHPVADLSPKQSFPRVASRLLLITVRINPGVSASIH